MVDRIINSASEQESVRKTLSEFNDNCRRKALKTFNQYLKCYPLSNIMHKKGSD